MWFLPDGAVLHSECVPVDGYLATASARLFTCGSISLTGSSTHCRRVILPVCCCSCMRDAAHRPRMLMHVNLQRAALPARGWGGAEACMHTHRLSPIQHGDCTLDCTRDCTLDYILATYLGRQRKDCTTVAAHTQTACCAVATHGRLTAWTPCHHHVAQALKMATRGAQLTTFGKAKMPLCLHYNLRALQATMRPAVTAFAYMHARTHRPPSTAAKACLYEATGWPIDASHSGMGPPPSPTLHSV